MHVIGAMHTLHVQEDFLAMPCPSMLSNSLIWNENRLGPTLLHCECCPALPAIVRTVPLHGANELGQLLHLVSINHMFKHQ